MLAEGIERERPVAWNGLIEISFIMKLFWNDFEMWQTCSQNKVTPDVWQEKRELRY